MSITSYMKSMGFGDYSKADSVIREEMEDMALLYCAYSQSNETCFKELGESQLDKQLKLFTSDEATPSDVKKLRLAKRISAKDATDYYVRKGWTLPKFGFR